MLLLFCVEFLKLPSDSTSSDEDPDKAPTRSVLFLGGSGGPMEADGTSAVSSGDSRKRTATDPADAQALAAAAKKSKKRRLESAFAKAADSG
jgi:hypothetical protein